MYVCIFPFSELSNTTANSQHRSLSFRPRLCGVCISSVFLLGSQAHMGQNSINQMYKILIKMYIHDTMFRVKANICLNVKIPNIYITLLTEWRQTQLLFALKNLLQVYPFILSNDKILVFVGVPFQKELVRRYTKTQYTLTVFGDFTVKWFDSSSGSIHLKLLATVCRPENSLLL